MLVEGTITITIRDCCGSHIYGRSQKHVVKLSGSIDESSISISVRDKEPKNNFLIKKHFKSVHLKNLLSG